MSLKSFATLALATGFAAAGPISAPVSKRNNNIFGNGGFNGAVLNGFSGNGFNFGNGFNDFNNQAQVIQIQEQNLQIVDNGVQQQIVQQVNQVLVVDQVNNGFNNDLNNLFRKSNFRNQFQSQQQSVVMLVVQEIQIAVDDGRGQQFQQQIFAQSAVVANRGFPQTNTVMIFDSRTLIAQDILANNAFGNIGQFNGIAGATGVLQNALPTRTQGVQLFGAKPTWSSVAADPAATLGGIWQAELQDLQKNENDQQDNQLNDQIAAEEKKALEEAQKQQEQDQQKQDQQKQDQQKQDQQKQEQEAAKNGTEKA
ncbi:hypothetical protein DE146DRAFT_414211 [Phaeosphaeria sp. MPI-PUGE-AT-0046c]|nr:hypothetical protein DE146DRAFT_414211 [Phaeosphaeria sp. MPI-PUGE-AT-0046c]